MKIILLGPPGTGKGTQAERLSRILDIPHISTDEMFRQAAAEGSKLGVYARDNYWGKGQLVPDDITVKMVKERLEKKDCKEGFILDGFPRTIPQADALDDIVQITYVLDIESSEKTIINRLTNRRQCDTCKKIYGLDVLPKKADQCDCGGQLMLRDDDREEVIRERMKVYRKQTEPLVKHYKKQGKLYVIDGEKPIKNILEDILKITK